MGSNDLKDHGYRVAARGGQTFLVDIESRRYGHQGRKHRVATNGWRKLRNYVTAGLAAVALAGAGGGVAAAAPANRAPVAQPIASSTENAQAMGSFTSELQTAMTAGGFVGTVIGAGTGCLLGGVAGLPLAVVPGFLGGCLVGGAALAAPGGIIGTLVVGGPTLVVAGTQLAQVLAAPAK